MKKLPRQMQKNIVVFWLWLVIRWGCVAVACAVVVVIVFVDSLKKSAFIDVLCVCLALWLWLVPCAVAFLMVVCGLALRCGYGCLRVVCVWLVVVFRSLPIVCGLWLWLYPIPIPHGVYLPGMSAGEPPPTTFPPKNPPTIHLSLITQRKIGFTLKCTESTRSLLRFVPLYSILVPSRNTKRGYKAMKEIQNEAMKLVETLRKEKKMKKSEILMESASRTRYYEHLVAEDIKVSQFRHYLSKMGYDIYIKDRTTGFEKKF